MKFKLSILLIGIFTLSSLFSQERIPPPPCYANGNTGAGGVVGNGSFLNFYEGESINLGFGSGNGPVVEFNDVLVFYIATSAPGRNILDNTVDDSNDPYRIAISNSNIYGFGSTITFPEGFEVSYAIAVDTNSGGLYSIPSEGNVGNGGLNYITSVNSTLSSNTQGGFNINFSTSDIGIASEEDFYFVGLYVGHDGYTYDEGYGGILEGTQGADDVTYTSYRVIETNTSTCRTITLNNYENNYKSIDATYVNNKLHISGVNEEVTIRLYNLMGREVLNIRQQVNGSAEIPIELLKNQLQFIVIEASNKKKVLKIISSSR
jgi:hypothetical protein